MYPLRHFTRIHALRFSLDDRLFLQGVAIGAYARVRGRGVGFRFRELYAFGARLLSLSPPNGRTPQCLLPILKLGRKELVMV